jgi:hypothetical protein
MNNSVPRPYEDQRASWTEEGPTRATVHAISGRVKVGRIVDHTETSLTVQYGSSALFRLLGGLFTSQWFPLTARVTVSSDGDNVEVQVLGSDAKGPYLGDISVRKGEQSIGKRAFIDQFRRACAELSGSTTPAGEPLPAPKRRISAPDSKP